MLGGKAVSGGLARVMYTSRMRGDPALAGERLERIVAQALKHNLQAGVSGHLSYDAKLQQVWQVIEGDAEAVSVIWEHISKDERHVIDEDTVTVEIVDKRQYPLGWGLRFSRFEAASASGAAPATKPSESNIIQLSYKSFVSDREAGEKEVLESIVPHAMVKNARAGITGWLLYNDRTSTIYQVLEGPPETVERLWEVIRRDPRHTICPDSVSRRAVGGREFPNWSMGCNAVVQSQWASQGY